MLPLSNNKENLPVGSGNKRNKKKRKRALNPVFVSLSFLFIIVIGVLFFKDNSNKSLFGRDFSFLSANAKDIIYSQRLFVEPAKNIVSDSPDINFVQDNSIARICPPVSFNPQSLGTILGEVDVGSDIDGEIREYVVEAGDTLSSIAQKFNISQETILWANNLKSKSDIKNNQKLIILPVSGVLHMVKDGDTVGSIAKVYGSSSKEVVDFNNLSDEGNIYIGDILVVPGGKVPQKSAPSVPSIPLADSYFIFPCEGTISQGPHGSFFSAIDIANQCGKIVVAAAGGVVQKTGYIKVGGNMVNILHPNGVVTYYGHLSKTAVAPGQTVGAGDIIGYIGNTGYTIGGTGCHLHFEVRGAKNFLSQYPVGTCLSWRK
ncbi:MAG: peptidoglycan DD-metalloendopeptidase family protein [Candidatus Pacebacteria bacterium]|nr:peptidoglycan DD-metalloendopeptidase family protein [Candidatus Paceibacterota bacterium]